MRLITCGLALAALIVSVGQLAAARPYWSYHNASTLAAKPQAYRDGYVIGIVDGYFAAHGDGRTPAEATELDRCISRGLTANKVVALVDGRIVPGAKSGRKAAADLVLAALLTQCRGG